MIVLLLAISHIRASFSDPGEMEHVYSLYDFAADTCRIHIGLETYLQIENLSDMNWAKDKFPVSNLTVYFSVQVGKKIGWRTGLIRKTLLNLKSMIE